MGMNEFFTDIPLTRFTAIVSHKTTLTLKHNLMGTAITEIIGTNVGRKLTNLHPGKAKL